MPTSDGPPGRPGKNGTVSFAGPKGEKFTVVVFSYRVTKDFLDQREILAMLEHQARKGSQELMGHLGYQDYPDRRDRLAQAMVLDLRTWKAQGSSVCQMDLPSLDPVGQTVPLGGLVCEEHRGQREEMGTMDYQA
uniref:Uncharacterized protein n=1 Tax=Sphaerodactylus townsendi TaxID=933632 RepID=A0ACB8FU88_9SAUR